MTREELFGHIQKKQSFLCVGLDTDLNKIPKYLLNTEDPIFEFNKQIIDATAEYAVAYKPNIAFYEAYGVKGWQSLEKTIAYIPKDIFVLADAKRGDIGNTSKMYAKAFFENMNCDAITVAPYMGEDSVKPFLEFKNKWVILLALTSNLGREDFQNLELTQGGELYEDVLRKSQEWGSADQLMFVVGATRAEALTRIRAIVPNHFLLVPGVGAQGGSSAEVAKYGMNNQCGLLVNSSRGIIYASQERDFAKAAGLKAKELQIEMSQYLAEYL